MSETNPAAPATPPAPAAPPPAASPPATPPAPVAFAETLPEDIRNEAAFRDIKDLGALAKGFLGATKLIGGRPEDLIKLPGPDDAEGWNAVHARLGRPEKPDGYGFKAPEGVTVDAALQGAFGTTAHQLGLTAKQATGLFEWWNGANGEAAKAAETARAAAEEQAIAGLKTEWGDAFKEKLGLANEALLHYGGQELADAMRASFSLDPRFVRMMSKLGAGLKEDGLIGGGNGGGGAGALSPAEARQQIGGLEADPTFVKAYTDKHAPGHAEAVQRMARLHEFAHPAAPKG